VAYVRADQDGDGVSELLRVVYAHAGGTAGRIIERVEWDGPASIVLASPLHTIRVATSGEYRFEFAFICSHPSPAFQNVSLHGIGAPTTCFHVITSVFGGL
jgi:hypothetical protein